MNRTELAALAVSRSLAAAQTPAKQAALASMVSTVIVSRPGELGVDASGAIDMGDETQIYQGPAEVETVTGPLVYALGDEPQYFSQTFVTVPLDAAGVEVNDVVEITAHVDESLVGRYFRITDVGHTGMVPYGYRLQVVGIQTFGNPAQ